MSRSLIACESVTVDFHLGSRMAIRRRVPTLRALDDVTLHVQAGERLAIIGESGSGKSTLARVMTGLVEPSSGNVTVEEKLITGPKRPSIGEIAESVQMVFQDPNGSMNPAMTMLRWMEEPLRLHRRHSASERMELIFEALRRVGLNPEEIASRHAVHLSGGQKQRVAIARALLLEPSVLICDESLSALDLSTQAQVLRLLLKLEEASGLTLVMISHDLALVRNWFDRIVVMTKGVIAEEGSAEEIFDHPESPVTRKLIDAIPSALKAGVAAGSGPQRDGAPAT